MSKAHRGARPKGYMDWKPTPEVQEVVDNVQAVLREYAQYGAMTVRQIFYRLVGNYGYPKDERAYKRLAEYLVKARRSQMISFSRIRDDGTDTYTSTGDESRADFWETGKYFTVSGIDNYRLDRQLNQPQHIELWCEAGGMAPMLAGMVRQYNVPVYSTGGFSSVTVTYQTAQRIAARIKPTYFLHVGDYDPSGESIFTSMSQDIGDFVASEIGGSFHPYTGSVRDADGDDFFMPRRVALTEDQVEEFDLPTAPPKMSDTRSARWVGETTQAEAMPPTLLEQVVTEYIEGIFDPDAVDELKEREEADKERLNHFIKDVDLFDALDPDDAPVSLVDAIEKLQQLDAKES